MRHQRCIEAARRARRGGVPTWIPIGIFVVGCAWFFDGLSQGVAAAGNERIDPRRARLDVPGGFLDPRWGEILRLRLAALPASSTHDRGAVDRIAQAVASLPFVAEVGEARVLWPDGVDVPLRVRRAAACVRQGEEFLIVSDDGVILPGRWPTPPWIAVEPGKKAFLPVIGPNDGAFDSARPGERLSEPRHLDALAVALSMRAALDTQDHERLGPPLIDASQARAASVEIPGVVLRYETGRTVYFGRSPLVAPVGERPIGDKWQDLKRAVALLPARDGSTAPESLQDWVFLDVRFERGDIAWRTSAEDQAGGAGGSPAGAGGSGPANRPAGTVPKKPAKPARRNE